MRAAFRDAGGRRVWAKDNPELAAKLKESFWLKDDEPITEQYTGYIDGKYKGR